MKHRVHGYIVLPGNLRGPLENQLAPYSQWLDDQGYAPSSSYQKVCLASGFSLWLKAQGVSIEEITSAHSIQYLRHRGHRLAFRGDNAFSLQQLLVYLRGIGVIGEERIRTRRPSPLESCLAEYEYHLQNERALSHSTILIYTANVRALLKDRFTGKRFRLEQLCAQDIVTFVQRRSSGMSGKVAKLMTTALRSFLRYLHFRGFVPRDLTGAVPSVAAWTMSTLPRAISAVATEQLLASVDRTTAVGLRDYALLVLFARLGLRVSEVMRLELDDIEWMAGSLSYCGKGGHQKQTTLPDEVGMAIAEYLQHGRPRCESRRVFLRHRAPVEGFRGPAGIDSLIRRRIQRAGVDTPSYGAHQFRHALAIRMLQGGASLGEIGTVLDHRSPETTRIYAKVDVDALRTLAAPWPGGVL